MLDGRVETNRFHDDDGLLNGAEDTVHARPGSLSNSVDELYPFQGREPVALNVEASRLWNGRLKKEVLVSNKWY